MFKICISHCCIETKNLIFDLLKKYNSKIGIEIIVCINMKYELDYFVRNKNIDVFILDPSYVYGDYDGLFIAERIKIINRKTNVIFVSNNVSASILLKIINAEPFGYIHYDKIDNDMTKLLDKAIHIKIRDSNLFTYNKRNEKYTVPLKNIVYFSSSHRTIEYTCINQNRDTFYSKMSDVENIVSKLTNDFVRINQSYLINKNYVMSINGNEVTMVNNHIISLSRKYHKNIFKINE